MKIRYPLFSKNNIPAYAAVFGLWAVLSLLIAAGIRSRFGPVVDWWPALIWSLISVMAGMGIMFVASAINLRKMRAGFERLADGEADPGIPRVWCPVLTMATRASLELKRNLDEQK